MLRRLLDLWHYRELVRNLVVRDLKVRYRNSVLGFVWSLFNPLLMMLVLTFVFTVLFRTPPNNVPYPLFLLTGLLAWNFCSSGVLSSITSVVGNAGLITKVYFPREVLPISSCLAAAVNFLLALMVLLPLAASFGIFPGPYIALFPLVLLGQILFVTGIGLLLASINVFFRDTEVIMEVVLLAWFFLTPIFYDITQVWPEWNGLDLPRLVRIVNPMASFVTTYREILLTNVTPDLLFLLRTLLTSLVVFVVGYAVFLRLAPRFGDEL